MNIQEFYNLLLTAHQLNRSATIDGDDVSASLASDKIGRVREEIERIEQGGEVLVYKDGDTTITLCCDEKGNIRIKKAEYIDYGGGDVFENPANS